MRYGLREIANVMLKAKVDDQKVGNKTFKKGQPICHFTSLKTSNIEGAATTVYAQGGRGNSRLIAWEGERTLTLTMEDALISPMGIAILTGAGLIELGTGEEDAKKITTHMTETIEWDKTSFGTLSHNAAEGKDYAIWVCALDSEGNPDGCFYKATANEDTITAVKDGDKDVIIDAEAVLVDYYATTVNTTGAMQIDIEPGKFGGNYYLEAETLIRDEATGRDDAAEFILPNCHIQSNFTFTMASSGDPSTFTFTVDAFPGVVYGTTKKVLCAIQIVNEDVAFKAGE